MDNLKSVIKSLNKEVKFFDDFKNNNLWDKELINQEFNSVRITTNYINYYNVFFEADSNYSFKLNINHSFLVNIIFLTKDKIVLFDPVTNKSFEKYKSPFEKFYKNFIKYLYEITNKKIIAYSLPYYEKKIDFYFLIISKYRKLNTSFDIFINLKPNTKEIWSSLRKSYKALINRANSKLKFNVLENSLHVKSLKNLHIKVSGKITRNDQTWSIQKKMIDDSQAIIFEISYEKQTLGMSFFTYDTTTAYYDVGVYDRELTKKHFTTHFMLWNAITYFKKNGISKIYLDKMNYSKDSKINDIVNFKLGFSNEKVLSTFF